jgi:hypothetical protein
MAELMQVAPSAGMAPGTLSAIASIAVLGLVALMGVGSGNDDDDSTPGGGLMQPVS